MRPPAVVMVTVREPSATVSRLESGDHAGNVPTDDDPPMRLAWASVREMSERSERQRLRSACTTWSMTAYGTTMETSHVSSSSPIIRFA
jgi:hypothetical protein